MKTPMIPFFLENVVLMILDLTNLAQILQEIQEYILTGCSQFVGR